VRVDSSAAPATSITNLARVDALTAQVDTTVANDSDIATATITSSDIQVTKRLLDLADDTVQIGDTLTFQVVARNLGPFANTNVQIHDDYPGTLAYLSNTTSQGTYDDGTRVWTVGSMAVADSAFMNFTMVAQDTATAAGNFASWFDATLRDHNSLNDTATVTVTTVPDVADVVVFKSVDKSQANAGETVTFTLSVQNFTASGTLTEVVVRDTLPTGLTFVEATPSLGSYDGTDWRIPLLPESTTVSLQIQATADSTAGGSVLTNTAFRVESAEYTDTNAANDTVSASVNVLFSDMAVTLAVNDSVPQVGDTLTFTVWVNDSTGFDAAADSLVQITYLLPAGLTYVTHFESFGTYTPGTGLWDLDNLGSSNRFLQIIAAVDEGVQGDTLINVASLTSAWPWDNTPEDNVATLSIAPQLDLEAVLTRYNPETPLFDAGGEPGWQLGIVNHSSVTVTNVVVVDTLSPNWNGFTYFEGFPTLPPDSLSFEWTIPSILPGDTVFDWFGASYPAVAVGTILTQEVRIAAADQLTTNPENDTDADTAVVASGAVDLSVTQTVDNPTPFEGDNITYTVTVSNVGTTDVWEEFAVLDSLGSFQTPISQVVSSGYVDADTDTWYVPSLAAGSSETFDFTVRIAAGTADSTLTNRAITGPFTGGQYDTNAANDTAHASVDVVGSDMLVTMTADNPVPAVGTSVLFEVSVDNAPEPREADSLLVQVTLPAGVTYEFHEWPWGTDYNPETGVWRIFKIEEGWAGFPTSLGIQTTVQAGTQGTTLEATAEIIQAWPADRPDGNADTVSIEPQLDLALAGIRYTETAAYDDAAGSVDFGLTVTNSSNVWVYDVVVRDSVTSGFETITYTEMFSGDMRATLIPPRSFEWVIDSIAPAGTAGMSFGADYPILPAGTALSNHGWIVSATEATTNPANDTIVDPATVQESVVDVAVSISEVPQGRSVIYLLECQTSVSAIYQVTATNSGPRPATNVVVHDTIPASVSFTGGDPSVGSWGVAGGVGVWTIPTLASGQTATLTFQGTFSALGSYSINARTVSLDQTDTQPSNNDDQWPQTVDPGLCEQDLDLEAFAPIAPSGSAVGPAGPLGPTSQPALPERRWALESYAKAERA
jgi:uncharacterized repeat protein (TIGR01451 family)